MAVMWSRPAALEYEAVSLKLTATLVLQKASVDHRLDGRFRITDVEAPKK